MRGEEGEEGGSCVGLAAGGTYVSNTRQDLYKEVGGSLACICRIRSKTRSMHKSLVRNVWCAGSLLVNLRSRFSESHAQLLCLMFLVRAAQSLKVGQSKQRQHNLNKLLQTTSLMTTVFNMYSLHHVTRFREPITRALFLHPLFDFRLKLRRTPMTIQTAHGQAASLGARLQRSLRPHTIYRAGPSPLSLPLSIFSLSLSLCLSSFCHFLLLVVPTNSPI